MNAALPGLEGTGVLLTGAAGGIGQALAIAFATAGSRLLLVDRPGTTEPAALTRALDALGATRVWLGQDLADTERLAEFVDTTWARHGPWDVLVNNAGIAQMARFNEVGLDGWRAAMAVDLDAPFVLSARTAEHLVHEGRRGRIVMISSKNGLQAEPGLVAYNAAKGGLELMARSLAVELGAFGITVNTVCPGMVHTPFAGDFGLDWPRFEAYYREHIPLENRFAQAAEIAGPVLFLASTLASYVTGHALVVDGGVLANQVPREQFLGPFHDRLADHDRPAEGAL
ncbi:MAG: SDR family oxidoreductase [Cellulomonas sp.]|nr:SDR family oxidoreductase [Cellulomonas sp.]